MKTVKGICKNLINTVIVCIMAAILFSVMTFCWLADTGNTFVMNFNSSTASAYFAGGNGSKKEPYKISTPVHMYNFAWLQYLGYFNLKDNFNNGRAQSFFELTDNIDMSSIAIPPIGTREYPFIGYFNGNGKTVYNVTVSNSEADFTRRPSTAQFQNNVLTMADSKFTNVDIVGLFGVTGDFNSFITNSYEKKDTTTGKKKTVLVNGVPTDIVVKNKEGSSGTGTGTTTSNKLEPLPSGNTAENVVYYSGMNVNSMYIDKITVKSVSPKTLVGLAAGYISSTVQNVGVYRSKVSLSGAASGANDVTSSSSTSPIDYGSTVSRYTIVGDYDDGLVSWEEVPTDKWGGSIDMKTLNRRLGYMIAESNITRPALLNASSSTYNIDINFNAIEYYWKDIGNSSNNIAYFNEGTVLPLNVDKSAMGLDGEVEIGKDVKIGSKTYYLHTNSYYENNTTEKVAKSNTGYLVGIGTGIGPRARIQTMSGLENSVNGSSTFDAANFTMLTVSTDGTTYIIDDGVNRVKTEELTNKKYGTIKSTSFEYYDSVRKEFIDTMTYTESSGNTAGEKYIHGFHFLNSINLSNPGITDFTNAQIMGKTYANYELLSGGLNFSAKEGSLRVIVGSYFATNSSAVKEQSLFDLFKVDRDSAGNILHITKIEKIYKNGDNISYNENTVGATDIAFDFVAVNKKEENGSKKGALKCLNAAYYFEIPITAGDYVIGCDNDVSSSSSSNKNTAYLMYLDIGANGKGGGETRPYTIQTVDFVAASSSDTGDFVTVPESGYPSYEDVGFKLGAGTDVIHFKRESYGSLPADGKTIETPVYYWSELSAITINAIPSELASEDTKKEPYWTVQ